MNKLASAKANSVTQLDAQQKAAIESLTKNLSIGSGFKIY